MLQRHKRYQRGMSAITTILAISGVGVMLLVVFLLLASSPSSDNNQDAASTEDTSTTTEPAFIRLPDNSRLYENQQYGLSFAYPDSFGELTENNASSGNILFRAESALANGKPVGNGKALMNGRLGVYVYSKDDFKMLVSSPGVFATPTKTGNDITWKISAVGNTNKDVQIGDAYNADTTRSQSGITVFTMPLLSNNTLLGRLVFESGDHYILIALPYASRADGGALTETDAAAYNVVLANIAKTIRIPSATSEGTDTTSNATDTTTTTDD